MLVNSVVSVFYYLVVPRQMFLRDAADPARLRVPALVTAVVALAMIAILVIFVLPNAVARLAEISTLVGIGPEASPAVPRVPRIETPMERRMGTTDEE